MTLLSLILAIIMVESGGDIYAVGDNGKAYGCMQIHQAVVTDVNRVYGTTYTHDDMFNRGYSIDVFIKYTDLYCTKRRLGREPTFEDLARCWNGGPMGYKKKSTIKYWEKVKKEMENGN